jgi:hypothetical protein
VLDRWHVDGVLVGGSTRNAVGEHSHEVRPLFAWVDERMAVPAAA